MILTTVFLGLLLSVFPALLWWGGSKQEARVQFGLIWLADLGAVLILIWTT